MHTSKNKWSDLIFYPRSGYIFVGLMMCLGIAAALGFLVPKQVTGLARSYTSEKPYIDVLWVLAGIFCLIYINRVVYQLLVNIYVRNLVQYVRMKCYRNWMFSHAVITSKRNIAERYPQGEVLARIVSDSDALRELLTSGTFGIFIDIAFVASCMLSFIDLNAFSGASLAFSEIAAALFLLWGSRRMREVFHAVSKARGIVQRTIANLVGGLNETYYNSHNGYASQKGEAVFSDYLTKILKSNVWDAGYYSFAESLYPLLLCLMVFVFPYSGIREAALIFAIVDLIQRSIGPIRDIASKITNIQRASAGIGRLQEFLSDLEQVPSTPLEVETQYDGLKIESMRVKIDHFQYPKRRNEEDTSIHFAVQRIDFTATSNQVIGLVGLSGCGKSTLLNIMAAQIIPDRFLLSLKFKNGCELNWHGEDLSLHALYQRQIGLVSQESHLFSETLQFNIAMSSQVDQEFDKFWDWICDHIHYLRDWELRPCDVINPKMLSAGQRQLLSAVRACYLKKSIVLLDEISSALDSDLEAALRAVLKIIQYECLTFIVAHRLETVINADRILIMEEGRLSESGKHEDLLARSEVYQNFVSQLSLSQP